MLSAQEIVTALNGQWHGSYGMACCPAHNDRTPSFSVTEREERVLFRCHAGCEQDAVIDALRRRGLFETKYWKPQNSRRRPVRMMAASSTKDDNRKEAAQAIWSKARPPAGTTVERYLESRGISIKALPSIRFNHLKHGPTGLMFPTMVANVQDVDGKLCGIHRTFLKPNGNGKAGVSSPKMALGPISGGIVRLAAAGNIIALVEGIEDALAVQQMTGQPAWACLGTSGFKNFVPPPRIRCVILAPDTDAAGDAVIETAAPRMAAMGLEVRIVRPAHGKDWCDMLVDFDERAALREFDGEEARKSAEAAAWTDTLGGGV